MTKLAIIAVPRVARNLHRALAGPQGLAILSGLSLAGYWFGGEGLLLFSALVIPAAIAFVSMVYGLRGAAKGRDGLTGLMTRQGFVDALDGVLERPPGSRGAACVVLALDEYDELGQRQDSAALDEVVQRTADRLKSALREGDLTARIGPARFAVAPVALRQPDLETGIQVTARLIAAIAEPIALGTARIYVTASGGFALPRQLGDPTAAEMLDAAESALAEALAQGRGSIRAYSPGVRRPRVVTARLVADVPGALDSGEIQAWFQPQISTDTGDVVGFEALARWQHPRHGMVAPAEFLPAVAAAGRVDQLSRVIMTQALAALAGWSQRGLNIAHVSVNLGEAELRDPNLPDRIRWELDRNDLDASRLCFEILETVLPPQDDDIITRNIHALAEMGVTIDLDDFGTGNASIAAIRRFAVDRIKIDRSFVTRIDSDRGQQEMAAAILSMAERLNLGTLAEGVETIGEHAMLAQLGCGAVQGFGIAPPMPYDETRDWIEKHRSKIAEAHAIGRGAL